MFSQLAYVSLSPLSLDETTLSDILEVSRLNNARDEITGILMYHDELFFQVRMECPHRVVQFEC